MQVAGKSGSQGDRVGGQCTNPDNDPCALDREAGGLESPHVLESGGQLGMPVWKDGKVSSGLSCR